MFNASLMVRNFKTPKNKTLVSIDYQISYDGNFDNDDELVVNDKKDNNNLSGKEFLLDFDTYDVYYGRMRFNFNSSGSDYYQDRPVVITKDGSGYSHNNSVIVTPSLSIDSDVNNCELGGFTITGSEFILFTGLGNHKFTNWRIKDTNNSVIWNGVKNDRYNLTSLTIPNDILEVNKIYIIECVYISDGNQRSNTGKLVIKTTGKSRLSEIVEFADTRVSGETYDELMETYEELLEIVVNEKALG